MLELIFIDIPLAVLGYAASVALISKALDFQVHEADEIPLGIDGMPSQGIESRLQVMSKRVEAPTPSISTSDKEKLDSADEVDAGYLPTDSQLRRHFITNLFTIATDIHPQPEDSTLRRHHEQLVLSLVQMMIEDPRIKDDLEDLAIEVRAEAVPSCSDSERDISVTNFRDDCDSDTQGDSVGEPEMLIPEDSVLRRHFIQTFVAQVETLRPKPTDNTLIRHHDQWVESLLDELSQKIQG